jgi:hypothetical protein
MTGSARIQGSSSVEPQRTAAEGGAEAQANVTLEHLRAENLQLREELRSLREQPPPRRRSRLRAISTSVLVVLTSLALVGATVGIWFERTVWDTDRYVALVAPIADDPAVTDAIAARLTVDVFEALDISGLVEEALASIPNLPPSAAILAGPITAGAQEVVRRQVETFLASQTFRDLWLGLNRRAHTKIVALLEGEYEELPNVSIEGGVVQLNLVSAVAQLLQRVVQRGVDGLGLDVTVPAIPPDLDASAAIARLETALGASLPEDFGQLTIMTESQLTGYQETARTLDAFGGALALLTIVLLGLTLSVATDRRRALIWVGAGAVIALFLGGIFIRRVEGRIVDSIQSPGAQAAARDIFAEVSSSLRQTGLLIGIPALLIALGAYLAGRPPWLMALFSTVRRVTAQREGGSQLQVWVSRHADATRIVAVVAALLVLFATGIDWLPVAVVGTVLALLLWRIEVAQRRTALLDISGHPEPTDTTTDEPAQAMPSSERTYEP